MPLGDILTRPQPAHALPGLTNQQIADFMLELERERRRAAEPRQIEIDAELDQLVSALS